MRPALDSPRGARFLTPALVSPVSIRPRIAGHPRAYLAATVATAFRGLAVDALAAQLNECALTAQAELASALPLADRVRLVECARAIQRAARRLHVTDRVPVLCAVVRELLTDAPTSCMALDIAVREACEKRHATTEGHRAEAVRVIAEVLG